MTKAFEQYDDEDSEEERLPFGELALLEEMVTRAQLELLLAQQQTRRTRQDRRVKIGTLLVREGHLSKRQGKRILKIQKNFGPIEGYQLVQHLGSGGMGSVFRAIQLSTDRELAVKILPPRATRDSRYRTRFLREAKLLGQLSHPNLVKCYDQGESNDHLYYAMEFVPGKTGRALLKERGAFSEDTLRSYLRQTLLAMEHYWESRVVHRDIKPENIMFTPEGQAKLTDLGLSRQLDDGVHITRVGKTLGTPLYISPELAQGQQDIDIRSDLYSLGASFFHMACGVPPFIAQSQAELLKMHVEDPTPSPRLRNPLLSEGMEAILVRLLEKQPADRFQSPACVLEALARLERGDVPVVPPPTRPRKRPTPLPSPGLAFASPRRKNGWSGSSSGTRAGWRPRKKTSQLAPIAVVLGFSALFSIGVLLGSNTSSEASARESVTAGALAPMLSGDGGLSEEGFLELLDRDPDAGARAALAYGDVYPEELATWNQRLQAAAARLPEGPTRADVEAKLATVKIDIEASAWLALESLREELIRMVEGGRFEDARTALSTFPEAYRSVPAVAEAFDELQRGLEAEAKASTK